MLSFFCMKRFVDMCAVAWLLLLILVWYLIVGLSSLGFTFKSVFGATFWVLLLALPSILWFVFLRGGRERNSRAIAMIVSIPFLIILALILIAAFGL